MECDKCRTVVVWHVVLSLVSGIIIGVFITNVVSYYCRKYRSKESQSDPAAGTTEIDANYQELDLTKINTEDNYQSLTHGKSQPFPEPETAETDSTYQQLDLTKMNEEYDYESLRVNPK